MAKDPDKPRPYAGKRPTETAELLDRELRRRGMSEAEIVAATKKRKRRNVVVASALKARHLTPREMRPAARGHGADELCTVEFAADRLKLHPKTILRFIKEGRLKATRIGKSYRIVRADLDALGGIPPEVLAARADEASVTSIVDVPGVSAALAAKWSTTVMGALISRPRGSAALRADVIHDPERSHLKIVVVGPPSETVNLLSLIRVWLEQLMA